MSVDWKRESRWFASIGLADRSGGLRALFHPGRVHVLSKSLLIGGGVLFVPLWYWVSAISRRFSAAAPRSSAPTR